MIRVVFVPGSGRDGEAAWPRQRPAELGADVEPRYLGHDDLADPRDGVLRALGDEGAHVVAHSSGAVAATLAAAADLVLVRSLVLIEPACFALARGGAEVERHIAQMQPVFDLADDGAVSDQEFAVRFLTALGAEVPDTGATWLPEAGARWRRTPAPWSVAPSSTFLDRVPTSVVTGGWNALYEEVATALVAAGARHVVVPGHGHRPHDGDVARLLREQWFGPVGGA